MSEFFVKATVCASIDAETRVEALQALCDRLPDVDRYTVATVEARPTSPCPRCDGEGSVHFMNMHPEDYEPPTTCSTCGGTGGRK